MKQLTEKQWEEIRDEIKMMLHAHRDCLRNRFMFDKSNHDPRCIRYDCRDGYYGEAFGIIRCLAKLKYGHLGAVNIPAERTNLRWWFSQLEDEVLEEEGFGGDGVCEHCLKHYKKDDSML